MSAIVTDENNVTIGRKHFGEEKITWASRPTLICLVAAEVLPGDGALAALSKKNEPLPCKVRLR